MIYEALDWTFQPPYIRVIVRVYPIYYIGTFGWLLVSVTLPCRILQKENSNNYMMINKLTFSSRIIWGLGWNFSVG